MNACVWAVALWSAGVQPADLVVTRANVHTVDPDRPRATAFAVAGGKFVFVGDDAGAAAYVGPGTTVLELPGKTVTPGFIDAHAHPRPIYPDDNRWAGIEAGPHKCKTIDDLVDAVRRKAATVPKGQWITGRGYQETKLGRHPTRHDLDRATTDHPVIITHSSGHLSVCNSRALELAKVTRETPDPPGGVFDRDAAGEPTGLLKEKAAGIVRGRGPKDESPPEDEVILGYRECFRVFHAAGITGVHVAGTDAKSADRLAAARDRERPMRLYIMLREGQIAEAARRKAAMKPDEAGVRYGGIKMFHGNSLSGQTSWLSAPYAHRADYWGVPPARTQEALNALVRSVHDAGLQACIHSNGDREIEMVLTAYEAALAAAPRADHRHRIEHCSVVNPPILDRIRTARLVIAPHSYVYEHGDKMENYGADRFDWMHPNRSLIDQGTVVAGNSDYPVSAAEPLLRIHDMVNRVSAEGKLYGPKQRCTPDQAIRAFTWGGAYAEFAEDRKGTIAVGKLADFVVLSADPATVPPLTIKDIAIERTVVGGKTVFGR